MFSADDDLRFVSVFEGRWSLTVVVVCAARLISRVGRVL